MLYTGQLKNQKKTQNTKFLSILMYKEFIHKFHSWKDNLSSKSDNVLSPIA